MKDPDLTVVRTYLNAMDAEMAKGLLEASGIPAMITADDCGGMRPHLQLQGVELLVRVEDADQAVRILDAGGTAEEDEHED